MDGVVVSTVYEWLARADVGTTAFGTGPFEGEALIVERMGDAIRLQVTLSPRVQAVDLLPSGEIRQVLPEVREGNDAQWPLVESRTVDGTLRRPSIRLWAPGLGPDGTRSKYVTLFYVGPGGPAMNAGAIEPPEAQATD